MKRLRRARYGNRWRLDEALPDTLAWQPHMLCLRGGEPHPPYTVEHHGLDGQDEQDFAGNTGEAPRGTRAISNVPLMRISNRTRKQFHFEATKPVTLGQGQRQLAPDSNSHYTPDEAPDLPFHTQRTGQLEGRTGTHFRDKSRRWARSPGTHRRSSRRRLLDRHGVGEERRTGRSSARIGPYPIAVPISWQPVPAADAQSRFDKHGEKFGTQYVSRIRTVVTAQRSEIASP